MRNWKSLGGADDSFLVLDADDGVRVTVDRIDEDGSFRYEVRPSRGYLNEDDRREIGRLIAEDDGEVFQIGRAGHFSGTIDATVTFASTGARKR